MNPKKYDKSTQTKKNNTKPLKSKITMTDDEKIDVAAAKILNLYRPAFEELAK